MQGSIYRDIYYTVRAQLLQSCPTLCDPMDTQPARLLCKLDFSGKILAWGAMPSSRGSS